MYYSVMNNDIETIDKLLNLGDSLLNPYSKQQIITVGDNMTTLPKNFRPLHIAMAFGSFDAVSLILEYGDNRDEPQGCSITPREFSNQCLRDNIVIKPLYDLVQLDFTLYSDFVQILAKRNRLKSRS